MFICLSFISGKTDKIEHMSYLMGCPPCGKVSIMSLVRRNTKNKTKYKKKKQKHLRNMKI